MRKRVVLCDLDGCVGQFVNAFLNVYRLSGGDIPPDFVVNDWFFHDRLPDQTAVSLAWKDPRIFLEQEPYPQAPEALSILHNHSDLLLVTSSALYPVTHVSAKIRWISSIAPWIEPKQLIFTSRKELIDGDVFIDDYHENAINWRANHPDGHAFLIARPWNKDHWERAESEFVRVWDGELIGLARLLTERGPQ